MFRLSMDSSVVRQNRKSETPAVFYEFVVHAFGTYNYPIRILSGSLRKIYASRVCQQRYVLLGDVAERNKFHHVLIELLRHIVIQGKDDFAVFEYRIILVGLFEVQRQNLSNPSLAMYHIRSPSELLDCLQYAACEEDRRVPHCRRRTCRRRRGRFASS